MHILLGGIVVLAVVIELLTSLSKEEHYNQLKHKWMPSYNILATLLIGSYIISFLAVIYNYNNFPMNKLFLSYYIGQLCIQFITWHAFFTNEYEGAIAAGSTVLLSFVPRFIFHESIVSTVLSVLEMLFYLFIVISSIILLYDQVPN